MENFDLMAKAYDTDSRIERAKAIASEIRLHISGGDKKTAIEYGCGTGLIGLQLIDAFSDILFVDPSAGMIEQLQQKLRQLGKPVHTALRRDFLSDGVPDDLSVDYIFSSLVFHHIEDTQGILYCVYNMLSDTGHLIIVDLDTDDGSFHAKYPDFDGHNGFDKSAIVKMAENAGFVNVKAESFYYGSKTVNNKETPYSLFILDAEKPLK